MNSSPLFSGRGRLGRLLLAPLLVLLAALCTGADAFAQTADTVNPPGRVAQLNYFDGPVSFAPAGYDQWAAAVLNRPLTQGDKLWNDAGARSELHVGSTAVQMSGQTSLEFTTLNDQTVQLAVTPGSAIARVRELPAGQRFEIDTPNLALTASQPGDYRVDVDPSSGTTTVTVRAGSVQVFGADGVPMSMPAFEQISFSGNSLTQVAAQTAPPEDAFGSWAAARDAAEDRAVAARYVPRDMTGYQQLDNYGTWENDPSYGQVWVPTVTVVNWAPYRYGHWAYIAPWGWTWIDDQPWGFAPFHYGRWAMLGPRWCWVPGPITVRPVYAPALVGFIGGAVGSVSFSVTVGGFAQPAVGWFPLAPGEIWHPAFRASPTYVTEVNRTVIVNRNVTNITNVVNVNRVINVYRFQAMPQAVTAVTAKAFTQGEHLRGNLVPVSETELARARVVPPPAPTRDPRAIFAASRLTQPHPAPPPAAVERRVVSNPAFERGRAGAAATREALPGPQQRPQMPPNAATPPRGFATPVPERAAAPAQPPVRAPLANVPLVPREPSERSAPPRNEAIVAPPGRAGTGVAHRAPCAIDATGAGTARAIAAARAGRAGAAGSGAARTGAKRAGGPRRTDAGAACAASAADASGPGPARAGRAHAAGPGAARTGAKRTGGPRCADAGTARAASTASAADASGPGPARTAGTAWRPDDRKPGATPARRRAAAPAPRTAAAGARQLRHITLPGRRRPDWPHAHRSVS